MPRPSKTESSAQQSVLSVSPLLANMDSSSKTSSISLSPNLQSTTTPTSKPPDYDPNDEDRHLRKHKKDSVAVEMTTFKSHDKTTTTPSPQSDSSQSAPILSSAEFTLPRSAKQDPQTSSSTSVSSSPTLNPQTPHTTSQVSPRTFDEDQAPLATSEEKIVESKEESSPSLSSSSAPSSPPSSQPSSPSLASSSCPLPIYHRILDSLRLSYVW